LHGAIKSVLEFGPLEFQFFNLLVGGEFNVRFDLADFHHRIGGTLRTSRENANRPASASGWIHDARETQRQTDDASPLQFQGLKVHGSGVGF
jgi:hypothetical protein